MQPQRSVAEPDLLSLVSHELKSPLTGITAFAELLSENPSGNLSALQLQQVRLIRQAASQLSALVNDLLDLSQLRGGEFQLNLKEFDLRSLLVDVAAGMAPVIEHNSQHLELDVDGVVAPVHGDCDRLAQVVLNLLTNASKFSPQGASVYLRAGTNHDSACISVRDEGIGICAGDQGRLFTPFFRADNPRTRSVPGTGLGLYIARSIVTLHGGTIAVRSEPGAGSTFTVEIPAKRHA